MKLLRTKVLHVAILPLLCLGAASGDAPRSPLAVSAYAKEQQAVKKAEADLARAKAEAHQHLIEDLKAAQKAQVAKMKDGGDSQAIAEELVRINQAIKEAQAGSTTETKADPKHNVNPLDLLKAKQVAAVPIKAEVADVSSLQNLTQDGKFKTATGDGGTWEWDGKRLQMHYTNNRTERYTLIGNSRFMYGANADGVPQGVEILSKAAAELPESE